MKIFGFFSSLLITLALTIALSVKIGSVPPLGYFLDPFHGFWQNAEPEQLYIDPTLSASVRQPVSVVYDSLLIPHIFAENEYDLYWAQGFVQASHRLWQMEFVTHVAAGRISEIVGERALEFDRGQRRKGLAFAAENSWQAVQKNDTVRQIIEAYSDGINAYIESLKYQDYPVEYKLLNYRPEPWQPIKTALLLKYMADDLAGSDEDVENTNALKLFGKESLDRYFPVFLPGRDPVIPTERDWAFDALPLDTPQITYSNNALYTETIEEPNPDNGSNNWAVSGSRTRSGSPLLANDPHLGLNLPSIWYLVQLKAPGVNVFGATLPGSPGVVIGFNDSIAWGVTNARRDVKDWYKITFTSESRDEYEFGSRRLKTQQRIEEIKVRGSDTFYDTIIYTHYGPVVYDQRFPKESSTSAPRDYAMKWVAHDPSEEVVAFYELNRARNYNDYVKALDHYRSPAQNFVFASTSGDIAMWVQGAFPAKWQGQGRYLMDGSHPEQEWKAFIPKEHNAYVRNPARGFVSSANQIPADTTYPYYIYDHSYEHFRNRRINDQLSRTRRATPQQMMELQNDVYNQKASDILPLMLDSLDLSALSAEGRDMYDILRRWNYRNAVSQAAPAIFRTWWRALRKHIWDEFAAEEITLDAPSDAATIYLMKQFPNDTIFDSKLTTAQESLKDLLQESFLEAQQKIQDWQEVHGTAVNWGDYKSTSIQHMLQLDPFGVSNVPVGGGRSIVSANSERHGASWKMVVDLSESVKAWGVYPGGQSGNPGSYFYTNMVDTWAKGGYYPMKFYQYPEDNPTSVLARQTIQPKPTE
ncbi:penicillin acylase family protein [Tunicatimonas pelagia]|uniref:penicillin acylase family protein n=1 Tax=Tunicatimonas pelagia TaxID=931531 RepID=UPI0026661AA1|nr:penicillin acylase family protein [Tunicatimonas pelagia]WKN43638.1 penicillin acylase family protein [Tunicatimonas pelagia]